MKLADSDRAVRIAERLRKAQEIKDSMSLQMGRDGYEAKQMGKDFLTANGVESWPAYCAHDGLNYSTFNSYVRLYRTYGPDGIGISDEQWLATGPRKLDILSSTNLERDEMLEWVCDAEHMSVSDLIKEIKPTRGGKSLEGKGHPSTDVDHIRGDSACPALTPTQYIKMVKESPCCVCGAIASEYVQIHSHHWPSTKATTDYDHHVVPLCGECHQLTHNGVNFTKQIGHWLLSRIVGE